MGEKKIFFCFLYRNIADIERNWSVADESTIVSDSQFATDIQRTASTTIPTTATTTRTTTIQNDAGQSENMEYSGDVSSIEIIHPDSLRSGSINSIESSENV